jgi:hypothetical protein
VVRDPYARWCERGAPRGASLLDFATIVQSQDATAQPLSDLGITCSTRSTGGQDVAYSVTTRTKLGHRFRHHRAADNILSLWNSAPSTANVATDLFFASHSQLPFMIAWQGLDRT